MNPLCAIWKLSPSNTSHRTHLRAYAHAPGDTKDDYDYALTRIPARVLSAKRRQIGVERVSAAARAAEKAAPLLNYVVKNS